MNSPRNKMVGSERETKTASVGDAMKGKQAFYFPHQEITVYAESQEAATAALPDVLKKRDELNNQPN